MQNEKLECLIEQSEILSLLQVHFMAPGMSSPQAKKNPAFCKAGLYMLKNY